MEGREFRGVLRAVAAEEESSREFMISDGVLCAVSESDHDEEEEEKEEEFESNESLFSIDIDEDRVYVGVGKSKSSMDALVWTLKHAISPFSFAVVYLVHVFPTIRLVPSPLGGMLPKSQANPTVLEGYLAEQRDKRKKLLQSYIHACSASASTKVRVEIILVESDIVAKAMLELITRLDMKRLILGSTKSNLSKVKSKRGIASQILHNAPQTCDINIICKGEQVNNRPSWNASPYSPHGSSANSSSTHDVDDEEDRQRSPEMRRSRSESAVGKPVSVRVRNVVKWLLIKQPRRPDQLPISSFYRNLLK